MRGFVFLTLILVGLVAMGVVAAGAFALSNAPVNPQHFAPAESVILSELPSGNSYGNMAGCGRRCRRRCCDRQPDVDSVASLATASLATG